MEVAGILFQCALHEMQILQTPYNSVTPYSHISYVTVMSTSYLGAAHSYEHLQEQRISGLHFDMAAIANSESSNMFDITKTAQNFSIRETAYSFGFQNGMQRQIAYHHLLFTMKQGKAFRKFRAPVLAMFHSNGTYIPLRTSECEVRDPAIKR